MAPRVSIGMPVYNGENYVEAAILSLLNQTYTDFELIISDNASTDNTPSICRKYAAADPRVRFIHSEINRGAAWNFNRTFELASGEYFKWASHDDICKTEFIQRCVEMLDTQPQVVLCYTREVGIDEHDRPLGARPYPLAASMADASERFCALLYPRRGSPPVFGLIRSNILHRTRLIGGYDASDLVLLAELGLHGRFHEIPEELLLHREHSKRSVVTNPTGHSATVWFDTSKSGAIILPSWRVGWEYLNAIRRSSITRAQKLACYWRTIKWGRYNRTNLTADLRVASRQFVRNLLRKRDARDPSFVDNSYSSRKARVPGTSAETT